MEQLLGKLRRGCLQMLGMRLNSCGFPDFSCGFLGFVAGKQTMTSNDDLWGPVGLVLAFGKGASPRNSEGGMQGGRQGSRQGSRQGGREAGRIPVAIHFWIFFTWGPKRMRGARVFC